MKITIAGIGYVGLSNAVLLAQHNEVVAIDLVPAKVAQLNARQSPIEDAELQDYLSTKPLNLRATHHSHRFSPAVLCIKYASSPRTTCASS